MREGERRNRRMSGKGRRGGRGRRSGRGRRRRRGRVSNLTVSTKNIRF